MTILLAFIWLACSIMFVVALVRAFRKKGKKRVVAYWFIGGFAALIISTMVDPPVASEAASKPATPSAAAKNASNAKTTVAPKQDPNADKLKTLQKLLPDSCKHDVSERYDYLAANPENVFVVVPATIRGDKVVMQVKAKNVKFTCSLSLRSQDVALQFSDSAQGKKIEAQHEAAMQQQAADAQAAANRQMVADQIRETCNNVKVVIDAFNWSMDDDFVHTNGQVTNVSGESMDSLEAEISFYTADGTFVKSDDAFLKYDPVLPNQTSPFEGITTGNPSMATAHIRIKEIFGGEIDAMDRATYNKSC